MMKEKQKKILVWLFSVIILLSIVSILGLGYFFMILFSPASDSTEIVNFSVIKGQGVNAISRNLYSNKLIKSKLIFESYLWLKKSEDKIIAGEYNIPANINIVELTQKLIQGPPEPKDLTITIIEGWRNKDIAKYLEERGISTEEEFLTMTGPEFPEWFIERFPFLGDIPPGVDIEGYLFPDTYRISLNASVKDIIFKMLDNLDAKIDGEILSEMEKQSMTLHEVLTLASIVEAEVQSVQDRRKVADIFLKRLSVGMPLQSDATINYITSSGRSRSAYKDIQIDSRYNTYKYPGLPPGPINNPSLDSIKAVLFPIPNQYYYFLTDSEGVVHYGRSAQEHSMNRKKYLD